MKNNFVSEPEIKKIYHSYNDISIEEIITIPCYDYYSEIMKSTILWK